MNRLSNLLLFVLLVSTALAAQGQEPLADNGEATALVEGKATQFLERVSLNQMESAYADLLDGSELARRSEEIQKLITRTREIETKYGKYRSFERIGSKRVGTDLVMLKYLYKCERFPVIWYFTYYRDFKRGDASSTNNNWIAIAVRFDTRLETLE